MRFQGKFDELAERLGSRLPTGPRVGIIGGRDLDRFGRDLSRAVGNGLAALDGMVVITGGVAGAGERVATAYVAACRESRRPARLFHVLPEGHGPAPNGVTLYAGCSMAERRQVLGRLASVYVAVGGGIGTADEIRIARANGAVVVAAAASGGAAGLAWPDLARPAAVSEEEWRLMADRTVEPSLSGAAAVRIAASVLGAAKSES